MNRLSDIYVQKNEAAREGINRLGSLESARNLQNANIKETRKQQRVGGAIQGAIAGGKVAGPYGALAGGFLGALFG